MLKSGSTADIQQLFTRLRKEANDLIKSIVQLTWFMRGAISYHEMLKMSYAERQLVREWIEENLNNQKDSPHPTY